MYQAHWEEQAAPTDADQIESNTGAQTGRETRARALLDDSASEVIGKVQALSAGRRMMSATELWCGSNAPLYILMQVTQVPGLMCASAQYAAVRPVSRLLWLVGLPVLVSSEQCSASMLMSVSSAPCRKWTALIMWSAQCTRLQQTLS